MAAATTMCRPIPLSIQNPNPLFLDFSHDVSAHSKWAQIDSNFILSVSNNYKVKFKLILIAIEEIGTVNYL